MDLDGKLVWEQTYGGRSDEWANCLVEIEGGGYLLGGIVQSEDQSDIWLVRTDAMANMLWQKVLGGKANDAVYDVFQGKDGSIVLCGSYESAQDHDESGWIIKLSEIVQ